MQGQLEPGQAQISPLVRLDNVNLSFAWPIEPQNSNFYQNQKSPDKKNIQLTVNSKPNDEMHISKRKEHFEEYI